MAFTNASDFEDDFRKVGPDATAEFAPAGAVSNPTEFASSENLDVAGKKTDDDATEEDDDLEDDEDLDDEEEDDVDEDDLEDDEDDEDEEDDEEDEDDLEDDDDDDEDDGEDDEDDDDLEDDDTAVKARLNDAEKRVRGTV